MPSRPSPKTVLVTGANGCIGHAIALAFVRAGYKTYGLVRKISYLSILASEEIISLHGSASSPDLLPSPEKDSTVFDILVSTTAQIFDYLPHYNVVVALSEPSLKPPSGGKKQETTLAVHLWL